RLARLLDHGQTLRLHGADGRVGARRGELDDGPRLDVAGVMADGHAGELEVLEGARRLHAVVSVGRPLLVAQEIVLRASRLGSRRSLGGGALGARGAGERDAQQCGDQAEQARPPPGSVALRLIHGGAPRGSGTEKGAGYCPPPIETLKLYRAETWMCVSS